MGCDIEKTLNLPPASKLLNPVKTNEDISSQHFKKKRIIGKGSFGNVYLICSKETGKYYALKTIKIIKNDGDKNIFDIYNNLERILREAYILRRLDHSNIISFKGVFNLMKIIH